MNSLIFTAMLRSRSSWYQVGQRLRRMSTVADSAAPSSGVLSPGSGSWATAWQATKYAFKDRGPGVLVTTVATGTVGTIGYFCNREFERIDRNISDLSIGIAQTNVRIDDTAKTINARIDATNDRIDDTAKTINARIDATNDRIDDTAKTINARIDATNDRIDDTRRELSSEIKQLGDKVDQLKDLIVQQNQQRKSSWW